MFSMARQFLGLFQPRVLTPLRQSRVSSLSFRPVCSQSDSPSAAAGQTTVFCRRCGNSMQLIIPEGDSRPRNVCSTCSYTDYVNPRMIVGAIVEHEGKVLLCRRGIHPQHGLWTVPAGYMELGESSAEGAIRETMEEAGASIEILAPFVHFDIVGIGQAYLLFRAKLTEPYTFEARFPESLETRLFAFNEIPFHKLAFSSVSMALRSYIEDSRRGKFHYRHGTVLKTKGAGPNDPGTFEVVNLYTL